MPPRPPSPRRPRPLAALAALAAVALAAAVLPGGAATSAAPGSGRGDDLGSPAYRSMAGFAPSGPHVRVRPRHYTAFRVDTAQVRAELAHAPRAGAQRATSFAIPTPDGGSETFEVQRTRVMQAGLAAAHPEIQTWAGHAVDDPATSVALDVTPMGFHASVRPSGGQGGWYVDPAYDVRGATAHLSYYGGALPAATERVAERELPQVRAAQVRRTSTAARSAAAGAPVRQRVYRLALLSDPSYARYVGAANVTAEKVTLMNRVNQIYNDDLAIDMVLVDGTDRLNLATNPDATGANGPCGAHACFTSDPSAGGYVPGQIAYCDVGTLVRTQVVLGQLIGASNYDIGHLMLGVNGGGIAGLGVVGGAEKGQGCTGLPQPTGDFMAIDYVAHEMGHEFGGNHTFNGFHNACGGGNRSARASVEPGSGSSVMAYAGICGSDDLQPHTDPYFSERTLTEVGAYTGTRTRRVAEVQDVSLTGFDSSGDTITLGYPDSADTYTLVRGGSDPATAYNKANIASAVYALTGEHVTVAKWGYDPYAQTYNSPPRFPATFGTPDSTGFQVIFATGANAGDPVRETSDRVDMKPLSVTGSAGVGDVHVGETARGGAPGNTGFEVDPTANHDPVVTAPADRTIPVRTPFTLTGRARDADGDPLVYLWEQNDDARGRAGTGLVSNRKVWGPLFRVFGTSARVTDAGTLQYHSPGEHHATGDRSRTFPDMRQVLAGNTNARTGACPAATARLSARSLNCYSEFLPTAGYRGTPRLGRHVLHFRLTARDRRAGGGGVGHDDVRLRVDPAAGPFLVTSFHRRATVHRGARTPITWRVNGTRRLAHRVRILVSTDNGRTWTHVLKRRTPNDGRAVVRLPRTRTRHARVMVAAVGNYFFAVNDRPFRIR